MAERRGPGHPPRSLRELVDACGFRPERHAGLLDREELPAKPPVRGKERQRLWVALLDVQQAYRSARGPRERHAAARDFASVVRALHGVGRRPSWLRDSV